MVPYWNYKERIRTFKKKNYHSLRLMKRKDWKQTFRGQIRQAVNAFFKLNGSQKKLMKEVNTFKIYLLYDKRKVRSNSLHSFIESFLWAFFCRCLFPLDWIPHSSLFRPNKLTIVSFHSSCHHNFEECGNAAAKNDHFIQKLLQFIWYVHTAYLQGFFSKTTILVVCILAQVTQKQQ